MTTTTTQQQLIQALSIAGKLSAALSDLMAFSRTHSGPQNSLYLHEQAAYLMDVQAQYVGLCREVGADNQGALAHILVTVGITASEGVR